MERLKSINRFKQLIRKVSARQKILSIYFVAGYPCLDDTAEIILALQDMGVDLIEVGMPYSDPMVDGPVIQSSAYQALSNGMNLDVLFGQLREIKDLVRVPLVLMGYYNQVFRYGVEKFMEQAHRAGCSGILLPDLPLEEYIKVVKPYANDLEIASIQLVTPYTTDNRLENILSHAQGFLYVVSNPMTTGSYSNVSRHEGYFQKMKRLEVSIPKLLGFGIDNKEKLEFAYRYFDGAVIGSSFVKSLSSIQGNLKDSINEFFVQGLQLRQG